MEKLALGRFVETMDGVTRSSKKAIETIAVVDAIASQTNRLALDAGVQAARAGEHGRDLVVFAAEVRDLTRRSADAVSEIRRLIDDSIKLLNACHALADRAGVAKQIKPSAIGIDPGGLQVTVFLQNN
ncbi:MAG: methyl-accepting chemotaxis protein [Pseudomonadota bacterium]